jgi:hypothetical protein
MAIGNEETIGERLEEHAVVGVGGLEVGSCCEAQSNSTSSPRQEERPPASMPARPIVAVLQGGGSLHGASSTKAVGTADLP